VCTAIVGAALTVTVCGYRCLAVLCLGLLLWQFSRIFAVPRPIVTGFAAAAAAAVCSRTCLGQIGTIFFQTFLYSLFCDELPQLAYRKR
jgi:hypothetical protein